MVALKNNAMKDILRERGVKGYSSANKETLLQMVEASGGLPSAPTPAPSPEPEPAPAPESPKKVKKTKKDKSPSPEKKPAAKKAKKTELKVEV